MLPFFAAIERITEVTGCQLNRTQIYKGTYF
jgi:hypothetical protein